MHGREHGRDGAREHSHDATEDQTNTSVLITGTVACGDAAQYAYGFEECMEGGMRSVGYLLAVQAAMGSSPSATRATPSSFWPIWIPRTPSGSSDSLPGGCR